MTLRLHWLPGSAAMAPHAALCEIGAPFELARVERDAEGRNTAAYLALNPGGLIPTLEDGELVLTESAAIMLHLGDRFPESGLVPGLGTPERSQLYSRLVYLSNTLHPMMMRVIYPERFGTEGVREAASTAAHAEFERLSSHLEGREWLVGPTRTAADLYLFMLTRWGRYLDPPAWDDPSIRSHFLRTLELPGVRRMLHEQGLDLPPFAVS